jgi:hypothetical protein
VLRRQAPSRHLQVIIPTPHALRHSQLMAVLSVNPCRVDRNITRGAIRVDYFFRPIEASLPSLSTPPAASQCATTTTLSFFARPPLTLFALAGQPPRDEAQGAAAPSTSAAAAAAAAARGAEFTHSLSQLLGLSGQSGSFYQLPLGGGQMEG